MRRFVLFSVVAAVSAASAFAASETAPSVFRSTSQGVTKATVATPGSNGSFNLLEGYCFVNPNTYPVYVKLYAAVVGSVTVGATTPAKIIPVPAGGYMMQEYTGFPLLIFNNGITIAVTKNLADNDTTALDTAIYAEVYYK